MSLILTVGLVLVLAALVQYTSLRESSLPAGGATIVLLSTLAGGFYAAQKAGSRGLVHGFGVGLCFALMALIITLTFYTDSFTWLGFLKKSLLSSAGGSLGGVLGVGYTR